LGEGREKGKTSLLKRGTGKAFDADGAKKERKKNFPDQEKRIAGPGRKKRGERKGSSSRFRA